MTCVEIDWRTNLLGGNVSPDWKCAICLHLVCCPVNLDCPHLFCLKCVTQWSNDKKNAGCPVCRAPLPQQYKINKCIQKLVEQIEVHCSRCGATGMTLKGHGAQWRKHEKECPEGLVTCSRCNLSLAKKEFTQHLEKCGQTVQKCPVCTAVASLEHFQETLQDRLHQEYLYRAWTQTTDSIQVGGYYFLQADNQKWIPVRATHRYPVYEFQMLAQEERRFSSRSPSKIMSFQEGVNKFIFPGPAVMETPKIGVRVQVRNSSQRGMITAVDQQQVQINAQTWHHRDDLQLLPLSVPHYHTPVALDSDLFWAALTHEHSLQQIRPLKRQRC